jgi:predicted nucleotidyltransferase component of viral defense system
MKDSPYYKQAELLLRVLPVVMREEVFALKGGTAINFFWRDFPRLSVDIDLVYLPVEERTVTFTHIHEALTTIQSNIVRLIPGTIISRDISREYNTIVRLYVATQNATIKIEPNTVIRGTVFPAVTKPLRAKAEDVFELAMDIRTVSLEDLYGGKICAALDRQHPRDLFDIKLLFENEGLTEGIRKAFIVYLLSHTRPMEEVLNPGLQNIQSVFENEFDGMVVKPVSLEDLITTRLKLIKTIRETLTDNEKKFILSFKRKEPDWQLLGIDGVQNLPAVKWKLQNLDRMSDTKHKVAYKKLEKYLEA